ncbi:leishmanolysin-like peptidase isoform X1 [Bufo bufo]|uniref:leishmanolysin-like peptidase isoform X1 n=1 Tax=Bufo bufo TaxID=8384 RepID=UPI001ABDCD3F|nr:leishmanolysin-like peptidase isoform X1 [Bufo bufo]
MAAKYRGALTGGTRGPSASLITLAAVLLLSSPLQASSLCRHQVPGPEEVVYQVHQRTSHVIRRQAEEQLRMKIVYDPSIEDLVPARKRLVKNKLFPQAISYLQKTFQVRRPSGSILLSRQCVKNQYVRRQSDAQRYCHEGCAEHTRCGPVIVPEEHLQQCLMCRNKYCGVSGPPDSGGVRDADFILYVSAITTERCSQENIVAYAAYCQLEAEMDRPIAGYANLCPSMISTQPQEFAGMLSTVKHEIIHALGFSAGLFAFFYDDSGEPLTPRSADGLPVFNESLGVYQWSEKVVRMITRNWDIRGAKMVPRKVYLLVTPRVTDEVRSHFDCPDLEGMELENQGGMGTELNHWEKRLLENEAMTGSHTQNRVFSRITLALMEDTGWYRANYSMAQKLDWGRGKGCDFATKSCKFWITEQSRKKQNVSPFCDTLRGNPLQLSCRQDQRAVAICNLQRFPKSLPQEYQYFDHILGVPQEDLALYGGAVEIADFCPFTQEFSWHLSGEYQRSSDCTMPQNQPAASRNYGAERYGPGSVCLEQRAAFVMEQCNKRMSYPDWGSGCYQVSCAPEGLQIWLEDTPYLCSRAGQVIAVSTHINGWYYEGELVCPSCWDFCDLCPPERDPPPDNRTRAAPLDLCSRSSNLVVTLRLLMLNLLPLLAGFFLCVYK